MQEPVINRSPNKGSSIIFGILSDEMLSLTQDFNWSGHPQHRELKWYRKHYLRILSSYFQNSFASRDIFGVQISVARDDAAYALSILGHVASKPAFKPWETEDVLPTIRADLSQKTPYSRVFEDLHRAAFRNDSLSYSLLSSKNQIGAFKSDEMPKFADKHFVSGNRVLVGINVDHNILKNYAEESGTISEGSIVMNHMAPFRVGVVL